MTHSYISSCSSVIRDAVSVTTKPHMNICISSEDNGDKEVNDHKTFHYHIFSLHILINSCVKTSPGVLQSIEKYNSIWSIFKGGFHEESSVFNVQFALHQFHDLNR